LAWGVSFLLAIPVGIVAFFLLTDPMTEAETSPLPPVQVAKKKPLPQFLLHPPGRFEEASTIEGIFFCNGRD